MSKKLISLLVVTFLFITTSSAQSTIYCPALTKQLKYGLTDSTTSGQVTELQKFLRSYYNLTDTNLRVSGIFGRVTENYVKQFQQQESLVVTGIVGAVSRAKIASKCPDEEIVDNTADLNDGPVNTTNTTSSTTNTFTIGTRDSKSSEFVFNTSTTNLKHVVGSNNFSTTVRDWIGHSAQCSACYPGSTKTQTFTINNLTPNSSEVTLTIYTMWNAGNNNFSATITSGSGSITSGQTKLISSSSQNDIWTIVLKPTSSSIDVTLGNGLTTGTSYFYFDQIVAKVTTTSTNTTPTNQSCTFNNQIITHNSSVTAYQSASVTSPATCQSQTRTCSNGTLSGSYTNASCSVQQISASTTSVTYATSTNILANITPSVVGSYALYQRNSPKYIKIGGNYYFGQNANNIIYLYKRSENSTTWEGVTSLSNNFHRPPTLLSIGTTLHIIFETSEGNIKHYYIANADKQSPGQPIQLYTDAAWGTGNHYLGGAVNSTENVIYLCASGAERALKCGAFYNGWTTKYVQSYYDYYYVYPNLLPISEGGVYVDTASTPPTTSSRTAAMRKNNIVFKMDKNLNTTSITQYGTVSTKTFFNNDIGLTPKNKGISFLTQMLADESHPDPTDKVVKAVLEEDGWKVFTDITSNNMSIAGSAFTTQLVNGYIYIVGAGKYAKSLDGKIWDVNEYEILAYPKSVYTYGTAQTLQIKGGKDSANASKVRFVQELTHKSTGKIFIVEVSF